MDKKEINKLIGQRNQIEREVIKPVNFFEPGSVNKQDNVKINETNPNESNSLIKYTTYLTEDLITKIKIEAALSKKKTYQVIQQALEEFLGK